MAWAVGRLALKGLELFQPTSDIISMLVGLGDKIGFDNDHVGREKFVKMLLDRCRQAWPGYYVIVVNLKSKYKPQTRDNADDFVVKMGRGGGYRVIVFKSGQFDLYSDGGWINWGFIGGRRSGPKGQHVDW